MNEGQELKARLSLRRDRTRNQVEVTIINIDNGLRATQMDVAELEANLNILLKLEESLENLNDSLEEYIPMANLAEEEGKNLDIAARIISAKSKAMRAIRMADTVAAQASSAGSSPVRHGASQGIVKLPKLTMGTFNGDVENWKGFWSTFESAVHNNASLTNTDKFNYLKGCLEGIALKAIKGLSLNDETYDYAVNKLKERFGRVDHIVGKHMNNLMDLSPVTKTSDVAGLRKFYDDVEVQIRSLEALGQTPESYESLLWRIMMRNLPADLRVEFSREIDSDTPSANNILTFLRKEVECRERAFALGPTSSHETRGQFRSRYEQLEYERSRTYRQRNDKSKGLPSAASLAVCAERKMDCCYCGNSNHPPEECPKVSSVKDRRALLRKKGRCFICTTKKHIAKYCSNKKECSRCNRLHHVSVCDEEEADNSENMEATNPTTPKEVVQCSTVLKQEGEPKNIVLQTASAIISQQGDTTEGPDYQVRCFFDGGSTRTYIREDIVHKLGLEFTGQETLTEYKFQDTEGTVNTMNKVKFLLRNVHDAKQEIEIEALVVSDICNATINVPKEETLLELKNKGIKLADTGKKLPNGHEAKIGVLIGSDWFWALATARVERLSGRLAAVETILGWTLHGLASTSISDIVVAHSSVTMTAISLEEKISNQIKAFWELDAIGIKDKGSDPIEETENEIVRKFEETISYQNGRYEVCLPWKENQGSLMDNKTVAHRRTQNLFKKFREDPVLHHDYKAIMNEQLEAGIIERATEEPRIGNPVYYLPHRAVIRNASEKTRVRVVFDASSKAKGATSLNDCLHVGKNYNPELLDLIVKFRKHRVAFTADIEKAFLQILLKPEDRDAQRFLWRNGAPSDTTEPFEEYRITRVAFGVSSSPFLLSATIRYHLDQHQLERPEICDAIREGLYVDDLISGGDDTKEAFELSKGSDEIMSKAGMKLRKWKTNSSELKKLWGQTFEGQEEFVLTNPRNPETTILGLKWIPDLDHLTFDVSSLLEFLTEKRNTKRFVLQAIARVFDPLGLLSPFTVRGKFLFQELWQRGVEWDQPLDDDLRKLFENWCDELPYLRNLKIPRYFYQERIEGSSIVETELACFCDASEKGYAAVVYLRYRTFDGHIGTTLVAAKSRIAPLRKTNSTDKKRKKPTITLPKLELTAALLGARLTNHLQRNDFAKEKPKLSMWTDSNVALGWIRQSPSKYLPYVSNRVSEIQSLTNPDTWRHCRGVNNPADLPTRGKRADELLESRLWWEGPSFLKSNEDWKTETQRTFGYPKECEEELRPAFRETYQGACVSGEEIEPLLNLERVSTFTKALRTIAWMHRFVGNVRARATGKADKVQMGTLDAEELNQAEKYLIKTAQLEDFGTDIGKIKNNLELAKDSKLHKLDPFLDKDGLLCVGGRLEHSEFTYREKHPWILAPSSRLSVLIIDYCHQTTMHGGQGMTLTHLREKFWIPRARQVVKTRINGCLICRKLAMKPGKQTEAILPADRIQRSRPFEVTGVDFAGPLYTKTGKTTTEKSYIALFTCAVTRATHLELVSNLTTERFLQAFRQFAARRGMPRTIYSDNALTFKKASADLQELWKRIRHPEVLNFVAEARITWKFIIERGAWWGGWYERMVGLTKTALKKVLGKAKLDKDEMRTLLAEVEAFLNSRPLTFTYNEKDEPCPLTPAHFIIGERLTSLPSRKFPTGDVIPSSQKELTKRLKYQQILLERAWQRWHKEYLLELRNTNERKTTKRGTMYKVDDFVMIQEDKTPRMFWKTGLIKELFIGRDGIVRSCSVRLSNGTILKRPIQLIYKLELNAND